MESHQWARDEHIQCTSAGNKCTKPCSPTAAAQLPVAAALLDVVTSGAAATTTVAIVFVATASGGDNATHGSSGSGSSWPIQL
jgi:hypothetical protein